ncbi:IclR family transcriptional regulator [Bordetella genomosp. 9]|uniref:IclR family transcriptional regulator n=1 Tax=Bordetella genomosp. 9 TaxID=1416803 RepID=A0A1W6YZ70_9BORD|nr:helix-turn-helix domain-containing protein [Bordetella genomosp. 9]ARP85883.1 IclR family transcriptional regulator [Bordetella genomosp. 9]ARP89904.1 IclR family transcriptional regulator [Bordetella genomosp. 9]
MSRTASQDTSSDGVAAVERALAIVDAISQRTEPITLADLSRATGFYKSTLLRLIASLEKASLVVRRADGRYALGPFAHSLGRAYEATYGLTEHILPILQGLVEKGTESASFHVYHDPAFRMCLLRVDSHHSTLDRIRVGDLLPLDKGAAGRLITAYLVQEKTPEDVGLLLISMGERDPNCAAVASPVFGPDGQLCGAISLSGPKERFVPAAVKKMSKLVQEAARAATQSLGGRWPSVK